MLSPEDFSAIATRNDNNEPITVEEARELIRVIRRLDLLLVVFQNALELTASNAYEAMPELAKRVMDRCGRTETKVKKAVGELAAQAVSAIDTAAQGYLTTALMQGAQMLNVSLEELLGVDPQTEDQAEQPTT